jgi:Sec-independent protein translocase protein TatA
VLAVLAFIGNLGWSEILVILVIAVLIFGKDLPQAASKAYMQARKLRSAVDDLRRETGIERELRDIERNVREAEWEARRKVSAPSLPRPTASSSLASTTPALPLAPRSSAESTPAATAVPPPAPAVSEPASTPSEPTDTEPAPPLPPTDAAS